jgi:hypothetical protein
MVRTGELSMRKTGVSLCLSFLFFAVVLCFTQAQVNDLKTLVGKKAVAQRMPFYKPGIYQPISNIYAGQEVTIIDTKPSTMPTCELCPYRIG